MLLKHEVGVVGNLQELKDWLYNLADNFDNDFNGNNGDIYLWLEAKDGGFDNNLDYVCDCLEGIKEDKYTGLYCYTDRFLNLWMGRDEYYRDYSAEITQVKDKYVISVCWVLGRD